MDKHSDSGEPIPAIEIDNLTLQFGEQTVLDRFSLSVRPGQKVFLSGNSGAGKSSLLRCLLGFIVPRQGQIRIQGTLLDGKSVWHLRRQMAYVAQEPQLGSGQVRGLLQRAFTWKANQALSYDDEQMLQLCRRLYVPETLLDKDIAELSGGEKQRIAMISAILLTGPSTCWMKQPVHWMRISKKQSWITGHQEPI